LLVFLGNPHLIPSLYEVNPIFTTGQTWLGIAVTAGYTYFGVNNQQGVSNKEHTETPMSTTPPEMTKGKAPEVK
jgi:hypothetical protein